MDKDIILIISEPPRVPIYTFSPGAIIHTAAESNEILYNCIQTGKNGKTTAPYRHRESAVTAHRYSLSGHIHTLYLIYTHTHS